MAHIAIKDIRRTQTSIAFRFKTTFDLDFRRGCGDHLHISPYYLRPGVVIESVVCPEVVSTMSTIYVEGKDQREDNRFLSLSFDKFLYLNTAIHIFNIGKFEVNHTAYYVNANTDEYSDDYDDDDDEVEF